MVTKAKGMKNLVKHDTSSKLNFDESDTSQVEAKAYTLLKYPIVIGTGQLKVTRGH